MRTSTTALLAGCLSLGSAILPATAISQEMTQADVEQLQRLAPTMFEADERLKPTLLVSAHLSACLLEHEADFGAERLATLKLFDAAVDESGRSETASIIADAPAGSRSDAAAFLFGYGMGIRLGAMSQGTSLDDCVDTIKAFEAQMAKSKQ